MNQRLLPYGESNFERLRTQDFRYVDRTQYIPVLEGKSNRSFFFLRPRKFGKSLFLSMLQCYYGVEYAATFNALFADLYMSKNKTNTANSFYVMRFDFSGIDTQSFESTFNSFKEKVTAGIRNCNSCYGLLSDKQIENVIEANTPSDSMIRFLAEFNSVHPQYPLYILIDEYDYFTNELLTFSYSDFTTAVSKNGFVRKFYEVIKEGIGMGSIDRFFATGVTPVTLDSLTSGFNIATDLTLEPDLNEMLGFTESEVSTLINECSVNNPTAVLTDMRNYFNGSMFHPEAIHKIYNSSAILYFLNQIIEKGKYPERLIGNNLASDHTKIKKMVEWISTDSFQEKLEGLTNNEPVEVRLTSRFSFEKSLTEDDVFSLLFYNGLLTIAGKMGARYVLTIPNYSIKELYWEYFSELVKLRYGVSLSDSSVDGAMYDFVFKGKKEGLITAASLVMSGLSNRDLQGFREKDLKLLIILLCKSAQYLTIESEVEISGGYADLVLTGRPEYGSKIRYIVELKYLPISESNSVTEVLEIAKLQVANYSKNTLRGFAYEPLAIVFCGREGFVA